MLTPIDRVIAKVLAVYGGWRRDTPPETMRQDWDSLFGRQPDNARLETDRLGGVDAVRITAAKADVDRLFVYFHGGGYLVGSPRSHADLVARISETTGATGVCLAYRRAPEHVFPAPIEDALEACRALVSRGVDLSKTAFVGDSAGGNLALATALALRDAGEPMPAALVLLSPWTDLEAKGESYVTRASADPIHQRAMILAMAGRYLAGADAAQPLASPLNADLAGLPPLLVQVGDRETVLDDSRNLVTLARSAGVEANLQVWAEMIHVFQQFPEDLAEAREAVAEIGRFLSPRLGHIKEVKI